MDHKTVLVYAFTHLNLGDDLFLKILIDRYPHTNFVLIADKEKYANIFPGKNISFFRFPKTWIDYPLVRKIISKVFFRIFVRLKYQINKKYLKINEPKFDGVITIGGSLFIQPRDRNQYIRNMHFVFAEIFAAKPKFILGANFGPFNDENYLNIYHDLFKKYDDVSFRDTYSKSLFSDLENVRCSPDVVFSLKTENTVRKEKTVGFSLIDLSKRANLSQFTSSYEDKILQLIKIYSQKNYTIYLFSFCKNEGDENAINRIIGMIPEELKQKIKTVFYDGHINAFVTLFQSMEVMYATRFHAMILSLIAKQITIPVIYSKKMKNVLDDILFTGDYMEIEKLDSLEERNNENQNTYLLSSQVQKSAEAHFLKLDVFLKNCTEKDN